ncbi:MAG TPA: nuclear transport factor 2 family protein [Caulobacteraceae bacterium]|jgi:ketosteroid isomerase-like protein
MSLSRRRLFDVGAVALAGAVLAPDAANAATGAAVANEALVRRYYKSWEVRDWAPFDAMLTKDFTFSSPNDDRIDLATFKQKCWDSQVDFIKGFDLEVVMAKGDQVVVEYLCHTKNGKGLRNVEIHRVNDGKIEQIDCYFGGNASFPSAVSTKKG